MNETPKREPHWVDSLGIKALQPHQVRQEAELACIKAQEEIFEAIAQLKAVQRNLRRLLSRLRDEQPPED